MKAVENANDTLAQSGAAHDTVVDYDEIVNVRLQTSVGDVIDMSRKVIPAVAFSNESAELYVLNSHLFTAYSHREDVVNLRCSGWVGNQFFQFLAFQLVEILVHSLYKTEESHFGSVWNIRKNSMLYITINGRKNLIYQSPA